jgi:hypothetical protein
MTKKKLGLYGTLTVTAALMADGGERVDGDPLAVPPGPGAGHLHHRR